MSEKHGGPAFPFTRPEMRAAGGKVIRARDEYDGMSLRDYFAAAALPSTLSASTASDGCYDYVAAAVGAYQVADAMLAERSES